MSLLWAPHRGFEIADLSCAKRGNFSSCPGITHKSKRAPKWMPARTTIRPPLTQNHTRFSPVPVFAMIPEPNLTLAYLLLLTFNNREFPALAGGKTLNPGKIL
jgi:hypothetical protein